MADSVPESSPGSSPSEASAGSKVHWILNTPTPTAESLKGTPRVFEEEVRADREHWHALCVHEVRNLESTVFERIKLVEDHLNQRLDDVADRLHRDFGRSVLQFAEAERKERVAGISEIRRDLGLQRELQSQVDVLRRNLTSTQSTLADLAMRQSGEAASIKELQCVLEAHSSKHQAALAAVRRQLEQDLAKMVGDQSNLCDTLEHLARGLNQDMVKVTCGLEEARCSIEQLTLELAKEKQERARMFADFGHMTSGACAASPEHAKRHFEDEFSVSRTSLTGSPKTPDSDQTACTVDDVRVALGSSFAKRVGAMDAELRVELGQRMRSMHAELRGEVIAELEARVASVEKMIEKRVVKAEVEVRHLSHALECRVDRVEEVLCKPLEQRMLAVEEEVKAIRRPAASVQDGPLRGTISHALAHLQAQHAAGHLRAPSAGTEASRFASSSGGSRSPSPHPRGYFPEDGCQEGVVYPRSLQGLAPAVNRTLVSCATREGTRTACEPVAEGAAGLRSFSVALPPRSGTDQRQLVPPRNSSPMQITRNTVGTVVVPIVASPLQMDSCRRAVGTPSATARAVTPSTAARPATPAVPVRPGTPSVPPAHHQQATHYPSIGRPSPVSETPRMAANPGPVAAWPMQHGDCGQPVREITAIAPGWRMQASLASDKPDAPGPGQAGLGQIGPVPVWQPRRQ